MEATISKALQQTRDGLSVCGNMSTTANPLNIEHLTCTRIGFRSDIAPAAANTFNCIDTTILLEADRRDPTTGVTLNLTHKAGNRNDAALILPPLTLTMMAITGSVRRIRMSDDQLTQNIFK
tara:strand:- start:15 stop:380 length:366 start_codon:yes stop_codon:yes gene_type:complete